MIELPKIILASASPRRADILRTVGWPFETLPVHIDETRRAEECAASYVQRLAREKAETAAAMAIRNPTMSEGAASGSSLMIVVAADTTVTIDDHILEKPTGGEDAMRMLRLLNNRRHEVLTGVAVIDGETSETRVAHETTEVKFAAMSDKDIEWYVATGEPMDKAGAYAIQGLGARFIEGIRGDYFNVVGLPVRLLYELIDGGGARAT